MKEADNADYEGVPFRVVRAEHLAVWQKSRQNLAWPEKIRQSEIMREATMALRASRSPATSHRS